MSSVLESLAAFVQDPELALQAEIRMDHLRLHIADALASREPHSPKAKQLWLWVLVWPGGVHPPA